MRLTARLCCVASLLVVAVAATPTVWSQGSCAVYSSPPLLDTSADPGGTPFTKRALGVKLYRYGSDQYIVYNTGNDLAIRNLNDPENPGPPHVSDFNVPPFGDRDYNLFNFDICDDGVLGIAGFDAQGTVLFSLGTPGTSQFPSFGNFTYFDESGGVGGVTFRYAGQQYLVAKNLPGGCVGAPTLWRYTAPSSSGLQVVECVDADGQAIGIDGGYRVSNWSGDFVVIADATRKGYIFEVEAGPTLRYTGTWVYAPTSTGHGFAAEAVPGLTASAFGDAYLYDASGGLDFPALVSQWTPEAAHMVSLVAVQSPYLWMSPTAGQTYAYDVTVPGAPRPVDGDFWDGSQDWNAVPYIMNRDAVTTADGHWLFVARYSVLQRFEITRDCLLPELFADTFESGDTSAWSAELP